MYAVRGLDLKDRMLDGQKLVRLHVNNKSDGIGW